MTTQTQEDAERLIESLQVEPDDGRGRVGAWAPGSYMNRCFSCDGEFEGDKRAMSCKPCALIGRYQEQRRDAALLLRSTLDALAKEREAHGETLHNFNQTAEAAEAALAAARAKVIEECASLPRYDGNGGARLGESVIVQCINGRYVALEDIRALAGKTAEPVRAPDWYWCASDPELGGDTPKEAMGNDAPLLAPELLHTSFQGPDMWGVIAPSLMEGEPDEGHAFGTKEAAEAFCVERRAALIPWTEPTPTERG